MPIMNSKLNGTISYNNNNNNAYIICFINVFKELKTKHFVFLIFIRNNKHDYFVLL